MSLDGKETSEAIQNPFESVAVFDQSHPESSTVNSSADVNKQQNSKQELTNDNLSPASNETDELVTSKMVKNAGIKTLFPEDVEELGSSTGENHADVSDSNIGDTNKNKSPLKSNDKDQDALPGNQDKFAERSKEPIESIALDPPSISNLDVDQGAKVGNSSNSSAESGNTNSTTNHSANKASDTSDSDHVIHTVVDSPLTEHEGSNTFVSYRIQVKTDSELFPKKTFQVRRRYSDFYFLYQCLVNDFPTLLVPPLPDKKRMEYIKGGRFSEEFTSKRAVSLSIFLHRVCSHPIMKTSDVLRVFLADTVHWNAYRANLKVSAVGSLDTSNSASQNFETVTEFIMNSFKKPTLENVNKKEFIEIENRITHLQQNLRQINSIYSRVLERQNSISEDMVKFGSEFGKLARVLGNDIDGTHQKVEDMDQETRQCDIQLKRFASSLTKTSEDLQNLNRGIDNRYITSLVDLEHYIMELKKLIKVKNDKAIDYEMLAHYLEKAKAEKQNLVNGGSLTSTTEGTITFLTKKFESLAGISGSRAGNMTNERIQKLDKRIEMLEREKVNAEKVYKRYEEDILTESEFFTKMKNEEVASSLSDLEKLYLQFYTNAQRSMKELDEDFAKDGKDLFPDKLSADGEFFSKNQVAQNEERISADIQKIKNLGDSEEHESND